jgi:hypothetical protein
MATVGFRVRFVVAASLVSVHPYRLGCSGWKVIAARAASSGLGEEPGALGGAHAGLGTEPVVLPDLMASGSRITSDIAQYQ